MQCHRDNPSPRRTGFTLMEMLVVISLITLLISLLSPSLRQAKVHARRVECATQQRQLMVATQQYLDSFKATFPPHRNFNMSTGPNWYNLLETYGCQDHQLFHCPAMRRVEVDFGVTWSWAYHYDWIGYGYNGFFLGLYSHSGPQSYGTYITTYRWTKASSVADPSRLIVYADSHPKSSGGANYGVSLTLWWPFINRYHEGINSNRHYNTGVVAFADTHAQIVPDPEDTIEPAIDGTDRFIEYWDPQQRHP